MSDLERYVDGETTLEERLQIDAQMKQDDGLAQAAAQLEALNTLVQDHGAQTVAPESLRAAVHEKFDIEDQQSTWANGSRPSMPGRRAFLIGAGGTLAAGVAGLGIVSNFSAPATRPQSAVETFFHDFETYLAKDKAIDIAETSMVQLAQWFGARLPFELPAVGSAGQHASLVGGRLCWLLDRRLASLSYEGKDGSMVLYLMKADGIPIPEGQTDPVLGEQVSWHRSAGNSSLVWRTDPLLYVMVSQFEVRRLITEARTLLG